MNSANDILDYLKCHPVTARLLWKRGVRETGELDILFNPALKKLPNPFSMHEMDKGVEVVLSAILEKKKITIYGDYDVDGTCGASVLFDFLRKIGVVAEVFQPDRFKDGYGVHVHCVEELVRTGTEVLISVDCGITAIRPAEVAKKLGINFIILDHHKVGAELPKATAIVNPQKLEDTSGLKTLCGSGIAFFFIMALRSRLREMGFFENRTEPNLTQFLDLVAIATVADVMDVRGVNRILISHGLRVLEHTERPGLRAILNSAKIKKPTAMHCGFFIGPRINAAGRLEHASAAFSLLTTENANEAKELCDALDQLNLDRRSKQDEILEMARSKVVIENNTKAIVVYDLHWHEGVLGIVASKLTEEFKMPAFVLAQKEDSKNENEENVLKGSVRSYAKIDIMAAVSDPEVSKFLLNFGGHAYAGGVTLKESEFDNFKNALNAVLARTTTSADYIKEMHFDADVAVSEIDARLVAELENLGPFGNGFPEPVLRIQKAQVDRVQILKEKHLKLFLNNSEALWFNTPQIKESIEKLKSDTSSAFYVSPQWNEWQGAKRLQLRISHVE